MSINILNIYFIRHSHEDRDNDIFILSYEYYNIRKCQSMYNNTPHFYSTYDIIFVYIKNYLISIKINHKPNLLIFLPLFSKI